MSRPAAALVVVALAMGCGDKAGARSSSSAQGPDSAAPVPAVDWREFEAVLEEQHFKMFADTATRTSLELDVSAVIPKGRTKFDSWKFVFQNDKANATGAVQFFTNCPRRGCVERSVAPAIDEAIDLQPKLLEKKDTRGNEYPDGKMRDVTILERGRLPGSGQFVAFEGAPVAGPSPQQSWARIRIAFCARPVRDAIFVAKFEVILDSAQESLWPALLAACKSATPTW